MIYKEDNMKDPFLTHTLVKVAEAADIKKDKKKGGLKELLGLLDALYTLQESIEECIDADVSSAGKLKEFDKHVDSMLEEVVKLTSDGIRGIRNRDDGEQDATPDASKSIDTEQSPSNKIVLDDIQPSGRIRNTSAPTAPFTPRM